MLSEWCIRQESLGYPPTHREIKEIANRILLTSGDTSGVGKHWIDQFLARNPILQSQRAKPMDQARVNSATKATIKQWFQYLTVPLVQTLDPENIHNMDEFGIIEGMGENGLVVGLRNIRGIQRKQPGSRNWTSGLQSISASGKSTNPLVIFIGKNVQQQWFPITNYQDFKGWKFTAADNGWTTNETAVEWLKTIFIPETTPTNPIKIRLLVLDGHGSHITPDFMALCVQHKIHLIYLPPHTSHVLQPLDLSVFSVLKREYRILITNLGSRVDNTAMGKRWFLKCYAKARIKALTDVIYNLASK